MPKRAVGFAYFACAVGAGAYVYRVHVEHLTQQMQVQLQREKMQLEFRLQREKMQLEFELQLYRELPFYRRLLTELPSASELAEAAKNTRPE
ncbi:MAG: hypothetical protein MHM6MM_000925 [Cercozoa sp. M6MM]